jgi:hypothetical protein
MTERAEITGIQWSQQFEPALTRARELGRHVLLDFSAAPM